MSVDKREAVTCLGSHDEPVEAEVGYLCHSCFKHLRGLVTHLPSIATWLEVNIAAGGAGIQEKVTVSSDDPIPLRPDVLDLVGPASLHFVEPTGFELHARFTVWEDGDLIGEHMTWASARTFCRTAMREAGIDQTVAEFATGRPLTVQEHKEGTYTHLHDEIEQARTRWQIRPTALGGSDQRGEDAVTSALRHWAGELAEELALPWNTWDERNTVTGLVRWLSSHLSWIAEREWVVEFAYELQQMTSQAHRVAPWRAEIIRDREPCESCGVAALIIRMAEGRTVCERNAGGCGREIRWDHKSKKPTLAHDKPQPPAKTEINTGEAAALARVQPATIRSWARRGKLPEVGRDSNNRPLYSTAQVVRVAQEQDQTRHDKAG